MHGFCLDLKDQEHYRLRFLLLHTSCVIPGMEWMHAEYALDVKNHIK